MNFLILISDVQDMLKLLRQCHEVLKLVSTNVLNDLQIFIKLKSESWKAQNMKVVAISV